MAKDQEYSYPGDEDKESYSQGVFGATESWRSLLKNKRFMYSFFGIFGFYILLQLVIYLFFDDKDKQQPPSQPAPVVAQAPKQVEPIVKEMPPVVAERTDEENQALKKSISALSQNNAELKGNYQDLSVRVNQLSSQVTRSEALMLSLTRKVDKLLADSKKVKKKKPAQPKAVVLQNFYLKAAVHGRAWVTTKVGGSELTVKVGDHLPTYGVITAIHPYAGYLLTSSGREIHYAKQDS